MKSPLYALLVIVEKSLNWMQQEPDAESAKCAWKSAERA